MLVEIAQAIADEISALSGIEEGACQFRHLHEWDAQYLATLRVAVTPRGMDASNASRAVMSGDYRIGIVVSKRVETNEQASEVMAVAESILIRLKTSPVLSLPNSAGKVAFLAANLDAVADESINEFNAYRATIEATFKVLQA